MATSVEAGCAAWMAAIADQGWQDASLDRAGELSGLPAADIIAQAGDKIEAVARFQDLVAREAASAATVGTNVRERLFEGYMRGFDLLQANRASILQLKSCRDPGLFSLVIGKSGTGLRRLAAAAGMQTGGLRGAVRLLALGAIGSKLFETWAGDESADMAATMAELDRLLAKAEQAEIEGFSLGLVGLSGLSNPFGRGLQSSPDPRPE